MSRASPTPSENWKEQFMACLAVPIFAEMRQQEAIALRDQNKPDSLFRYRPLNQEREFENIESQQVWLTQPVYANDPFDSSFSLVHEAFILPEAAQEQLISGSSDAFGDKLNPSEIEELVRMSDISNERFRFLFGKAFPEQTAATADHLLKYVREFTKKSREEHVRQLNEGIKQNLSVCCFSESRDEILMWTHYADQSRGCCIEFDVRSEFIPGAVGYLLPVIYRDEPFDVTAYYSATAAGGGNNWANMLAACHKTKGWSYEREWRIVFPFPMQKGRQNRRIPIKSITMGVRIEPSVEKRLVEIAHKLKVPLYRTIQSYADASLRFEPVLEFAEKPIQHLGMFRAFLVYAIENYSKIPAVEKLLREDFKDIAGTTNNPEETENVLKDLEARLGFVEWKTVPEKEYNLAVTQILTNVNPYHIQWGITFMRLNRELGIEWCRWSRGD